MKVIGWSFQEAHIALSLSLASSLELGCIGCSSSRNLGQWGKLKMETHATIAKAERYQIWALVTMELHVSPNHLPLAFLYPGEKWTSVMPMPLLFWFWYKSWMQIPIDTNMLQRKDTLRQMSYRWCVHI